MKPPIDFEQIYENYIDNKNEENRKVQIVSTAIANEGKAGHETYGPYLKTLVSSLSNSYTGGYTPGGT